MPKISVVMPIYNSEKYISEAVDSVLNQTYGDFELLAVYDNGTNDVTPEILEAYAHKDNRVKPINIGEQRGLVKALNYGIENAKGTYIARMDADDICFSQRFEKQLEYMESNKDIQVLGTKVKVIGDLGEQSKLKLQEKLNLKLNKENAEKVILNHWYCLAHPSIIFRKGVIEALGGYGNHVAEDLDLWLRCLKNNAAISKIDRQLLFYRFHKEAKTQQVNKNYVGIKDAIELKLSYVFQGTNMDRIDCVIWGAGNGGRLTFEVLKSKFPEFKVTAFIDKFKTGEIEGIKVIAPEVMKNISFNYVFIATEPGKEEAIEVLEAMGVESIKGFLCTI